MSKAHVSEPILAVRYVSNLIPTNKISFGPVTPVVLQFSIEICIMRRFTPSFTHIYSYHDFCHHEGVIQVLSFTVSAYEPSSSENIKEVLSTNSLA